MKLFLGMYNILKDPSASLADAESPCTVSDFPLRSVALDLFLSSYPFQLGSLAPGSPFAWPIRV